MEGIRAKRCLRFGTRRDMLRLLLVQIPSQKAEVQQGGGLEKRVSPSHAKREPLSSACTWKWLFQSHPASLCPFVHKPVFSVCFPTLALLHLPFI